MLALFTMASIGSAQHLSAGLLDVLGLRSACTWLGLCDKTTPSGAEKPTVKRKSPKAKPAHPSAGQGGFTIPSQQGAPAAEGVFVPHAETRVDVAPSVAPPAFPRSIPSGVALPEIPSSVTLEKLCEKGVQFACTKLEQTGEWESGFAPSGVPTMARPGKFTAPVPLGRLPAVPWNEPFLKMHIAQPSASQNQPSFSFPSLSLPMGAPAQAVHPFQGEVPDVGERGGDSNVREDTNEDVHGAPSDDLGPCQDRIDNDSDGLRDDNDPDCVDAEIGTDPPEPRSESHGACDNEVDDNGDGAIDREDEGCGGDGKHQTADEQVESNDGTTSDVYGDFDYRWYAD